MPPKAMQQAAQPFVLLYELAKIVLRDTELLMRTPNFGGKHLVPVLHRYLEAVDDAVPHIHDLFEQVGYVGASRRFRYGFSDMRL